MLNDIPLVGDWNGTGTSKVGAFRPSDGTFYLDYNGSGTWEGCGTDRCLSIGMNGDDAAGGEVVRQEQLAVGGWQRAASEDRQRTENRERRTAASGGRG